MPTTTPNATAMNTDTPTTLRVIMAESQYPFSPIHSVAAPQKRPSHLPPSLNPVNPATATTTGQGSHSRKESISSNPQSMTSESGLKNHAKVSPTQSKNVSMGSWMPSSQPAGQSPNSVPASALERK